MFWFGFLLSFLLSYLTKLLIVISLIHYSFINKMCLSLGMIKGNELRIGNTVLSCGEIYNIECGEDIDQLSFEPISLNDEWLNKIGFEYDKYTNCVNYGLFYIRKDEDGFEINFYDNEYTLGEFSFHVQYVHQLENAYFSIHQEELTIK